MLPFNCGKPQKSSIADAVRERMARQQTTPLKTPSFPPPATTNRRSHNTVCRDKTTIDLTGDDNSDRPLPSGSKTPHLISPQSPVGEQPQTPHQKYLYGPAQAPQTPVNMPPSLLQSALYAASPRGRVESPRSPLDETANRKRKRDLSPSIVAGPHDGEELPRSPVEEEENPIRKHKLDISPCFAPTPPIHENSPHSPVEEASTRVAPAQAAVESPPSPVEETAPSRQTVETANTGLATEGPTLQKRNDITTTEVSDRFMPVTYDGVEYRNPAKFNLNPPFWRRWDSKLYVKFAEELRWQFDPVPFARKTGTPVEEITHVFDALVCKPLYYPKRAAKRGEDGMKRVFELYERERREELKRPWGKEADEGGKTQFLGAITTVRQGEVELVLASSGNRKDLGLGDLGKKDVKYLRDTLGEEDQRVLWG